MSLSILTQDQVNFYNENGYLIVENFFDKNEIEEMKDRIKILIESFDLSKVNDIFTTSDKQEEERNTYFLESADKIVPFLEDVAKDKPVEEKRKSINKIGHALHKYDPVFSKYTHSDKCRAALKDLGLENMVVPQSMVILKSAKVGGEVGPHQDSTFLYTEPLSCVAFWVPLVDVDLGNGCLQAIPGSHKYPLKYRFKLNKQRNGVYMEPKREDDSKDWPKEKFVPLETKAGSLVVIHGSLVHMSEKNTGNRDRNVYTWHMVDKNAVWSKDNWITATPFKEM